MFSVLMSVYHRDVPRHLGEALESLAWSSVPPPELVIVEDFPPAEALEEVIARYRGRLPIVIVRLDGPSTLGEALNIGLGRCSHALVARFDSDDVNLPDRFEKQLRAFDRDASLAILGGQIEEFECDPEQPYAVRRVPLSHDDIVAFAKWRNPFSHMTVMYRKHAVEQVGGYVSKYKAEDWDLWVRMLQAGYRGGNLPDVLVKARAGKAMSRRRGGWLAARSDYAVQKRFYDLGFLSLGEFLRNLAVRGCAHALPSGLRYTLYRAFMRQ